MSLIKCSECGHEISSEAEKCPNCGYKTNAGRQKEVEKNEIVAAVVFTIIGCVLLILGAVLIRVWYDDLSWYEKKSFSKMNLEGFDFADFFWRMALFAAGIGFSIGSGIRFRRIRNSKTTISSRQFSWVCSKCGNTNMDFVGVCTCGQSRPKTYENGAEQGSWRCMNCGKTNMNYVGTCACGQSRIRSQESRATQGSWKCPNCGKANMNYVGTCACGQSKP